MATLKKNAINQIMFTMVDKTDFATVEASLASGFTVKKFGVAALGTVASATITTVASAVKKVGSGVYKIALTASQCNYDQLFIRVAHASAATQMMNFELKTFNDADASDLLSKMYVQTTSGFSQTSNANSALISLMGSRISGMSDILSKIYVQTTSIASDVISMISTVSNIYINTLVAASMASDTNSWVRSTLQSRISGMSDILSKVYVQTTSIASQTSNANSALISMMGSRISGMSDILSKIYVQTTVAASGASLIPGMSDILSKVYVQTTSMASVITTKSDLGSQVAAAVWNAPYSNFVTASTFGSTLGGRISMASDIASAVWVHAVGLSLAARVSQVKAYAIGASNILSNIFVDTTDISDIASKIKVQTDKISGISNILSAVYVDTADISNILSNVHADLADLSGIVSDFQSNLLSFLTTTGAKVLPSNMSTLSAYIATGPASADTTSIAKAVWQMSYSLYGSNASSYGSLVRVLKTNVGYISDAISNVSRMVSDVYSLVSDVQSAVAAAATSSDIASKVWAAKYSDYTTASTFGSRLAVLVTSDALSKAQSSIESHVSGITATVSDSVMSDIASRVWSAKYTANSVASSFGSLFSDIFSRVVKIQSTSSNVNSKLISLAGSRISGMSDILSKVYAAQSSQYVRIQGSLLSGMSDILSKVYVQTTSIASQTSNANSAIISLMGSRMSYLSNVASYLSDTLSKVYVQTTSMTSDIISMISTVSQLRVRMNYSTASDLASLIATTTWGVKWDVHSTASSFGSAFEQLIKKTSYISDISSKTYSMLTGASWLSNLGSVIWNDVSGLSDLASRTASMVWTHTKGASALSLLSQLRVRAAYSTISDLTSKIAVANWGVKWDVNSTASSFGSAFEVLASRVSALRVRAGYSTTSDLQSGIVSAIWAASVSTFKTAAGSFGSRYAKLVTSDALSKAQSDIDSHISGLTVNAITADDISDIASAVWGESISTLKGVAASFGSRFAKITTSDALSKAQSSIESHVSGITATVDNTSIASAVWAHVKATSTLGYTKVAASGASLIPGMSDILSKVYVQTTSIASQTSNANSALISLMGSRLSYLSNTISGISDILSKVYVQTTSTVSAAQATRSKLASFVTNYDSYMSDISSRVWATAAGSNVVSRISDMYSYLSTMNAGVELSASAISDIKSAVNEALDDAFTDATVLTSNGLKERIRTMEWVLRNKMNVIKASGNTQIYKDDNATKGLSTAAALTSDATSVVRKRMA